MVKVVGRLLPLPGRHGRAPIMFSFLRSLIGQLIDLSEILLPLIIFGGANLATGDIADCNRLLACHYHLLWLL